MTTPHLALEIFEFSLPFAPALILDSRVLFDEYLKELVKQRFALLSGIVNKLEATKVERKFFLGNTPMGTKPTLQQ
jgi:hypothetical protein